MDKTPNPKHGKIPNTRGTPYDKLLCQNVRLERINAELLKDLQAAEDKLKKFEEISEEYYQK